MLDECNADINSLKDNVSAYDKFKIRPRVLKNVSNIDLTSRMLGQEVIAFSLVKSVC